MSFRTLRHSPFRVTPFPAHNSPTEPPPDKFLPGCYALHMIGRLPIDIVDELPENIKQRYNYMQSEEEAKTRLM